MDDDARVRGSRIGHCWSPRRQSPRRRHFARLRSARPDANVMPMQLRANLGNRLVLRVDGEGTSEIALGEKGAERLLGKGHLAAKLEGEQSLLYAQVPFVDSEFLEAVVAAIKSC